MAASTSSSLLRLRQAEVMKRNISRMMAAVEANDIEYITRVPRIIAWHELVDPATGNTLLHMAVLKKRKIIFDYLLSIVHFPVDQMNNSHETVLDLCLKKMFGDVIAYEYFSCELIKKAAATGTPHPPFPVDITLNHSKPYSTEAYLIWACLHQALPEYDLTPMGTSLMNHRHVPTLERRFKYNDFETAVRWGCPRQQETLFREMLIHDRSSIDIHIEIFLILAYRRSDLFSDTLKLARDLIVANPSKRFADLVFCIDMDYLNGLLKKFPGAMSDFFSATPTSAHSPAEEFFEKLLLRHRSIAETEMAVLVHRRFMRWFPENEITALQNITVVSSLGMRLNERILSTIFEQFGFGHLLKFALYMDVEPIPSRRYIVRPLLIMLYDVNCDLEQILQMADEGRVVGLGDLLHYFCDARLRALCYDDPKSKVVNQPDVPLLVEIARNAYRKHLIQKNAIQTRRDFYTVLNELSVPLKYKKIIKLETKLYK